MCAAICGFFYWKGLEMPEENLTGEPAAEDITGEPSAADLEQASGEETPAAGDTNAQVEAFKKKAEDEVQKRQALEQDIQDLRNQILIAQANRPQAQASQQPQDVFSQQGLDDDEPVTVGQVRQQQDQKIAQVVTAVQYQNFIAANPDYSEIVGTPTPDGRLQSAQPLKDLMNDNPNLRGLDMAVAANPGYAPVAYQLAKQHKELKELKAQQQANTEFQKNVEQKTAPMSPAAAGTGAQPGQSAVAASSDEEFEKLEARVQAGEFG